MDCMNHVPSSLVFSTLRRVFYLFSCGGITSESEFNSNCRHVSMILAHTRFQDLTESVQTLLVDVVEMAVIVFISRIFPVVRLPLVSFTDYVPTSCRIITDLFDLLDEQVTKHCSYGLQLRMASVRQLLPEEAIAATVPKFLDPAGCISILFPLPQSSQTNSSTNLPATRSMTPTPFQPPDAFLSSNCSQDSNSDSMQPIRAEAEHVIFDLPSSPFIGLGTAPPRSSIKQSVAPSVSPAFVHDENHLSSPKPDNDLKVLSILPDESGISHNKTLIRSKSPNPGVSSNPSTLKAHDHSHKYSTDLASVPSDLPSSYVSKNLAGQLPLSSSNSTPNISANHTSPDSLPLVIVEQDTTSTPALSKEGTDDVSGFAPSQASPPLSTLDARGNDSDTTLTPKTNVSARTRTRTTSATTVADLPASTLTAMLDAENSCEFEQAKAKDNNNSKRKRLSTTSRRKNTSVVDSGAGELSLSAVQIRLIRHLSTTWSILVGRRNRGQLVRKSWRERVHMNWTARKIELFPRVL